MALEPLKVDGRAGPGRLEIRRIDDLGDLAETAPAWNQLAERHPDPLPFNTYAWVSAYVEHRLQPGESWVCLQAWSEGTMLGVLPLTLRRERRAGIPGTIALTPFDLQTQFSHILADPAAEARVAHALTVAAVTVSRDLIFVRFQGLRPESPQPAAPVAAHPRWRSLTTISGTGAYLPIEGDFDAFRASLSRKLRSNLNRATHKLVRRDGVEFTRRRATEAEQGDLEAFLRVESGGWKGAAGTAIRCDPALVAFYTTLTQRLATPGWLEWHSLKVEGRVIASVLTVVVGRRVFLIKIGVDEEFPELSPGILLVERVIQGAFAEGVREVDFLTDPAWVQVWRPQHRVNRFVTIYPSNVRSTLFAYLPHRFGRLVKSLPFVRSLGLVARDAVRGLATRRSSRGSPRG